jgi:hypothetical protein
MNSKLILSKLNTLYKEYMAYKEFFDSFMEEVDEKKADIAKKMGTEGFDKVLEDFVLDTLILRQVYAVDMDLLVDRIITYTNAARLMGFEEEVDPEILTLAKHLRKKEMKPRFIIDAGKPVEVQEGFIDEQRRLLREQGNLDKLIKRVVK